MKRILIITIIAMMMATSTTFAGSKSDKQLATEWANSHGGGYTIEMVKTKAKGGYWGNVIKNGKKTKWVVKYPKKVKKGKRVNVYMVENGDDVVAMVCLGKVK